LLGGPLLLATPASAHASYTLYVNRVGNGAVDYSPFAVVYYEVWKQTNAETTGYVVFISTHRGGDYLAEIDNRISFVGGSEYGGACGSTFIGYTPADQQTGEVRCGNGVFGDDRVGSGNGYLEITPHIPGGSGQKWRSSVSGNTRYWWKEGGYTAWWSELNVVRAGNGLGSGDRIEMYVWYHFTAYRVFWWDHYYRGPQYWTFYT